MVDKKHLKIGIAVFAIAALVIGLSVGLTQKSDKSTNNASSSQAYGAYDIDFNTEDCLVVNSGSGKSGKSGGGTSDSGKSGKSGNRRALYVPGTEDAEASAGMRRKLRDELLQRGLGSKSYKAGKGQQTAAASSAGGKSEKASSSSTACYCVADATKSAKSGVAGTSEGKSGKSGGVVAGASASAKSGKSESDPDPSPSKSGKSESAGTSGCGKSGKSGGGSGAACAGASAPTVGLTCEPGVPPPEYTETFSTPPIIPADCICEEQPWVWDGAMCVRSCDVTGPGSPSATACCAENTASPDCPISDCGFIPSPSPTEGGTTTVATEKTSAPTQGERPFD